jgi:hypothetical protein
MITLALDASTYAGDVAILDGARVLAEESVAMKGAEHERLMPAIASALTQACVDIDAVGRVVCGAGRGALRVCACGCYREKASRAASAYRCSRFRQWRSLPAAPT